MTSKVTFCVVFAILFLHSSATFTVAQDDIEATYYSTNNNRRNNSVLIFLNMRGWENTQFLEISPDTSFNTGLLWVFEDQKGKAVRDDYHLFNLSAVIPGLIYNAAANVLVLNKPAFVSLFPSGVFHARYGLKSGKFESTSYLLDTMQLLSVNHTVSKIWGVFQSNSWVQSRYEYFHWAPFVLMAIFYIICFFLCCFLTKQQPMKSRGLTPHIICVLMFLDIFLSMLPQFVFTIEQNAKLSCYYAQIVGNGIRLTYVGVYLVHYIRFVTLTQLNERKEMFYKDIYQKASTSMKIPFGFRLLKFFGKWYAQLMIAALLFIFNIVWVVLFSATHLCTNDLVASIGNGVIFGIYILGFVLAFLYDLILAIPICCKKCNPKGIWDVVWKSDRLWFKFEFYFIAILFGIPAAVVQIVLGFAVTEPISLAVLTSIVIHVIFILGCGFVLLITILLLLRKWFCSPRKEASTDVMRKFIADDYGMTLFEDFSRGEFSIENVYAYKDVLSFQKNPTIAAAESVFRRFLNGDASELELNVSQQTGRKLRATIDSGHVEERSLNEVLDGCVTNMADTFSRFILTPEYQGYIKMDHFIKQGIEN